jgi:cation diffusion facilitator family transporter
MQDSHQQKKIAAVISLIIGFILLALKFYAYHVTGSKAILSDALESIVNVSAGTITLIVLIIAARPADHDHPYGHGKVESMASTFEGGAILFAGILIMIEGVQTFFHGAQVGQLNLGLAIVSFAGLLNGLLGYFLIYRGKKFHSEALRSSGAHLITDAVTSVGVLIGLFLVKLTGMQWIDPAVAFLFGIMLVVAGAKILIRSGHNLLDGQDSDTLKTIAEIFEKNYRPGVIRIHFTRVIRSGSHHHIDCHMVIPEFWTIDRAHDFNDEFEADVIGDYPMTGELHIHLDPCRKVYCESCEIKDCSIRLKDFKKRESFVLQDLLSPVENI